MIEVKHLTKRYGGNTAVSDLSFSIEKGQIYGFLGPNGAGKSTTMNIMTGCLAASSGEVLIGGYDIFEQADKAKRLIGYLPEQPPLYLDRTPREYLTFVGRAKGIPEAELPEKIGRVMEATRITDVADRLIKNLSKGYKQRVGIAQAILGDPEIIILDEPTVGLDPKQIIEIREMIKSLGREHTVILSSHILSEVQAICETILIISKGRLVACDTPENLEKRFAGRTGIDMTAEAPEEKVRAILAALPYEVEAEIKPEDGGKCAVKLETAVPDADDVCRSLFFAFADAGCPILRMAAERASLEDIFIELTNGEPESSAGAERPDEEDSPAADEAPAAEPGISETQEAEKQ